MSVASIRPDKSGHSATLELKRLSSIASEMSNVSRKALGEGGFDTELLSHPRVEKVVEFSELNEESIETTIE